MKKSEDASASPEKKLSEILPRANKSALKNDVNITVNYNF